jgi:hypothetical protein
MYQVRLDLCQPALILIVESPPANLYDAVAPLHDVSFLDEYKYGGSLLPDQE